MEWRERFLRILEHEEPDRLPLDIWLSPAFAVKLRSQLKEENLANFPLTYGWASEASGQAFQRSLRVEA
ncbi:hypothetical protein KEJ34_05675 [Candidatus Bathyarchaeota archaeon]|nr:hypothetical protein [Candidatus Bathyarchaeota archaeon]